MSALSQPNYMNEFHGDQFLIRLTSDLHKVTPRRRVFQVQCPAINRLPYQPQLSQYNRSHDGYWGALGKHQEPIPPRKLYYKYSLGLAEIVSCASLGAQTDI